MQMTTAGTTYDDLALAQPAAGDVMHFGEFAITETQSFPPPSRAQCWAYVTLNAEISLSLPHSPGLQSLLHSPRVRVSVDGQWLWWALRRKYPTRPLEKLSGSDLIHRIAAHCAQKGQRLLLLGSTPQANARAVQVLRQRWPALEVAGYAPPHYEIGEASEARMKASSLAAIRDFGAHYVVLGLGATKEHRFAWQAAPELDGVTHGLLCFGGAIDLASGVVRRAPIGWQRLGLEGIYRVLQQPARAARFVRVLRVLPALALGSF
ncbi:putative UDP-N-acetyl-D-mannosaminuronic acid transferase [Rubrivivax sp. A210]|uniref:WecB/TagA/CpsF family glycosyltransferase n=1 Tax=Rubrivivax sp. A210 TaxID=2772301 RepID=UPI001919CCDD|nr:WecB/TagA/CpsF family glycosyltransferase [Rubrivivax sp. A210]CAD5371285.1 putative UDP-N-acetyl-D-mannosaminuronic acid transferase [Rubrivivax sp. A210]